MTLNSYITVCTAGGEPVKTVKPQDEVDILTHSHSVKSEKVNQIK